MIKKIKIDFNLLIPMNLNLEKFLLVNPPKFKYQKDKFVYILNLMYTIQARNKAIKENKKYDGKVPINAQILQKKIRNYSDYLNYLIENKILETDNNPIIGEKSKWYWFTKLYNVKPKLYTVKGFKIKKIMIIEKKEIGELKDYIHLSKWFNSSLTIDRISALSYTESIYNINMQNAEKRTKRNVKSKAISKVIRSNSTSVTSIEMINSQNYFFNQDHTGNRIHTNLSNLKSELRNYLTYDNKQLVCVDIKNSQPYFSLALLNPDFYLSNNNPINIYNLKSQKEEFNTSPHSHIKQSNRSIIHYMLVKTPSNTINQLSNEKEFNLYTQLVTSGELYEYFGEKFNQKYNFRLGNRDVIKKKIFLILYSDENTLNFDIVIKCRKLFEELFPTVNKIFRLIKEEHHQALAILLQNIESAFILDIVTKDFAIHFPKIPIYTIHDSISTLEGYENIIRDLIYSKSLKFIDCSPTVHIDYWNPKNNIA